MDRLLRPWPVQEQCLTGRWPARFHVCGLLTTTYMAPCPLGPASESCPPDSCGEAIIAAAAAAILNLT